MLLVTVLLVGCMLAAVGFLIYGIVSEELDLPGTLVLTVMALFPLGISAGIVLALIQRIHEIQRGEIDDAKSY